MMTSETIFNSKTRAEIFRLLFTVENREYYLREIEKNSGLAVRSIQQELPKLLQQDLILSRKDGNRIYFKANKNHPLFNDIQNIVIKTSEWLNQLKKILSQNDIQLAFVFGSFATKTEKATSDIDLCIIGDISLRKLAGILKPISLATEREINPHLYSATQFKNRLQKKDHFMISILESRKIFIIGSEDELKAMGR